jgi:hypothetical protein
VHICRRDTATLYSHTKPDTIYGRHNIRALRHRRHVRLVPKSSC